MVHKTSKTVAQEVGLVKIKDKNTQNRLIITQTVWLLIDYRCRWPDKSVNRMLCMNDGSEPKFVDTGKWFQTLITRSEKNTVLALRVEFVLYSLLELYRQWVLWGKACDQPSCTELQQLLKLVVRNFWCCYRSTYQSLWSLTEMTQNKWQRNLVKSSCSIDGSVG